MHVTNIKFKGYFVKNSQYKNFGQDNGNKNKTRMLIPYTTVDNDYNSSMIFKI